MLTHRLAGTTGMMQFESDAIYRSGKSSFAWR
jgi:hypothetical protein